MLFTSTAKPAMRRWTRASRIAVSSTIAPREVLINPRQRLFPVGHRQGDGLIIVKHGYSHEGFLTFFAGPGRVATILLQLKLSGCN